MATSIYSHVPHHESSDSIQLTITHPFSPLLRLQWLLLTTTIPFSVRPNVRQLSCQPGALVQHKSAVWHILHCTPCVAAHGMIMQVSIASCVVGPLEYSTATLCLAHSVPFIYVKQGKSSNEPFICTLLHKHGLGMEMTLDMYNSSGTLWHECLDKLENWNRRSPKEFPVSTYR